MKLEFGPWKLEVDIEATKKLYQEKNYALDRRLNQRFSEHLTEDQRTFFASLGVDPLRIRLERKIWEFSGEDQLGFEGKIYRTAMDFLVCGKFLAIPADQMEIYGDGECFGKEALRDLEITDTQEGIGMYDAQGLGIGIRFKHPGFHREEFGVDEKTWESWDCGILLGSTLIFEEEA